MEGSKIQKKDVKTELIRLIGCFMVILAHIRLQPIVGGSILKTPVMIGAFITPSVGLFFLVTGFFIYEGDKPFWKVGKNYLLKILAPTLLLVLFTLVFENWLTGELSLTDCLRNLDLVRILTALKDGILHISSDYWGAASAHLWYIAEYAKVILFYPVMLIVAKYASNRVLIYLVGINLLFCCLIDLYRSFGVFDFFLLEPYLRSSQAIVLAGCLLYRGRDKLRQNRYAPALLLAAYAGVTLGIYFLQMNQFAVEGGDWSGAYFTTWLSGAGMLAPIFLTAFILSLSADCKIFKWLERPILFLGGLSFSIYLLQYGIILKMATGGLNQPFMALTVNSCGIVLYYVLYGGIVFAISALIAFTLRIMSHVAAAGLEKCLKAIKELGSNHHAIK